MILKGNNKIRIKNFKEMEGIQKEENFVPHSQNKEKIDEKDSLEDDLIFKNDNKIEKIGHNKSFLFTV